jgi:prepilin-type N-terminal cleavage/methylation domain-containing protein
MKNFTFLKKGFTVLELLVVLFIMTVLISIVLASFTKGNKNTQNKVSVSEVRLVQVALEEYRAQCRVYPSELNPNANNSYPVAGISQECILELGDLVPDDIDLNDFEYAALRSSASDSGVCNAYHISRELYTPSRYLNEDDDWGGDGDWIQCMFSGTDDVDHDDPSGWYDLVYGVPYN